jgi:uncharacterized tellurite resistance protein B-like protein
MEPAPQLSAREQSLFIEMLCCIAAADKKLSGKEVQCICDALASAGCHPSRKELEAEVVKYCQAIHKQTPERYVDSNHFRFQTEATTALAKLFVKAQPSVMAADGEASQDELRISQRLSDLLAARRGTDKRTAPQQDDNREPWKVALAIALLFPLGLYWLWKHPTLSKSKTWWGGAVAYVALVSLLGGSRDKTAGEQASPQSRNASISKLEQMRGRVQIGMSRKEVEKAIGRPKAKHKMPNTLGLPDEQWTYLNDKLGVNFRDGVVVFIIPSD